MGADEERVSLVSFTGGALGTVRSLGGRALDLDLVGLDDDRVRIVRRFGKGSTGGAVSATRRIPTAALTLVAWRFRPA